MIRKLRSWKNNLIPNLLIQTPKPQSNSLFCTKTLSLSLPFSSTPPPQSTILCHKILTIQDPKISVIPVLEKWVGDGREIGKPELQYLVYLTKNFRRFNHALEISQWMTDRRYFSLSSSDAAIRLVLIHSVHGLERAENYFNSISSQLKTSNVYGALLGSYVREKSVEKAEAIMQEMRKMGIANTSFAYNVLINLYAQIGQHDKIDLLIEEMKMKGIPQDIYSIRNLCAAYVAKTDISGMEKILKRIEEDSELKADWRIYSIAANGYLSAGLETKALSMLKKMEKKIPPYTNKAFEFLLSLYERTGRKNEVYRVWNTFKPLTRQTHVPYALMITSLAKLDDIEGAERIFQEWESKCTVYDFRVLNRLLAAYCRKGLFDKAESVVNQAVVGRTPFASTWSVLAMGYAEYGHMSKAVEMLKKAMLVGRQNWKPKRREILEACLDYLEKEGDAETMEEIVRLCKSSGTVAKEMYYRLLRTSIAGGKPVLSILEQMKMDGFSADEEVDKILGSKTNL